MLVTGDNSLQLFLGWEGVGLASYLLIHFWFTRLQADKAAIKAMLVNRVGSVIHAMSDEQDMRKMGGLASSFPFTYAMMLMGSLSLIGFPFLTGFYSKDVILELAYTKYTISGNFAFWLGSVSVLFTSYYSFRSLFLTFLVPTNSFGRDILRCHDAPIPMAIPLILLALGSLFVGYLAKV
ncbi:hypothetical protein RDI58_030064 [Solanum bulbocastanum]|uniref:NADH:quinone oxidoreductase/Mrp antiporter transmembrane domain-containing protein n=1 Tax=Solanum bulbocastanum TaxID=147425 RepID=A0AAN8SRR0_SOLBU